MKEYMVSKNLEFSNGVIVSLNNFGHSNCRNGWVSYLHYFPNLTLNNKILCVKEVNIQIFNNTRDTHILHLKRSIIPNFFK